jgi:2-amino-4-hydroxy-6-hydroxymethyldihydropteridine diphosphokinase
MYVEDQPTFLNAAVKGETSLSPRALLACLKRIEAEIGRLAGARYGPREVDLDLVAFGSLAYRYEEGHQVRLEVPHPRIAERRFVLQPLNDIAADYVLPGFGVVRDLLGQTEAQAASVTRSEHALLPI